MYPYIFGEVSKLTGLAYFLTERLSEEPDKLHEKYGVIVFALGAAVSLWSKRKQRIADLKTLEDRLEKKAEVSEE